MQDGSFSSFITLYGVLSGILIMTISLLFFLSDRIFEASKNEDIKEGGYALFMKISSFIVCLYLYVL